MNQAKPKMSTGKKILIGVGAVFLIGIVGAACADSGAAEGATQKQTGEEVATAPASVEKKADGEKDAIITKLKAKAKRDWPDDYSTQEYWVNEEIEAYEYMKTIPDTDPIKVRAGKDWPLDFSTQKYWYNEQIEAKERIK